MGLFDSIYFECSKCKETIEVQTKAGLCVLDNFDCDYVPALLAADIKDDTARCQNPNCKTKHKVKTNLPEYVACYLQPLEENNEH